MDMDRKDAHKQAMAKNKDAWAAVNVVQIAMWVPAVKADDIRNAGAVALGEYLYAVKEELDYDQMLQLGDKRTPSVPEYSDIANFQHDKEELMAKAARITALYHEFREALKKFHEAKADGNMQDFVQYATQSYCIAYLIRVLWQSLQHEAKKPVKEE